MTGKLSFTFQTTKKYIDVLILYYFQNKGEKKKLHLKSTTLVTPKVRKLLSKVTVSIAAVKGLTSNTWP